MGENGPVFPDGEAIISAVVERLAKMLNIDPLNHAHGFADGNSNALMAQVAYEVNRIADESNAATLVLHHLRKGSSGDVDDLMGATSLRATFRSTRILRRMKDDEAEDLGIAEDVWRYSRISASKANYSPPAEQVTWFELVSVALGNGDDTYPDGDECGVTAIWKAPLPFGGLNVTFLKLIFARLREEPEPGWYFSLTPKAKFWAGNVIMEIADRTKAQARSILAAWQENGVLEAKDYTTPTRNASKRVVVIDAKAEEILAPLRAPVRRD
jgi:hypothetical protein